YLGYKKEQKETDDAIKALEGKATLTPQENLALLMAKADHEHSEMMFKSYMLWFARVAITDGNEKLSQKGKDDLLNDIPFLILSHEYPNKWQKFRKNVVWIPLALISGAVFGASTMFSFMDDEEGDGGEGESDPAADDGSEPVDADNELGLTVAILCIIAAFTTNAANYGDSTEQMIREYGHNLNELNPFNGNLFRDGYMYNTRHEQVKTTTTQKFSCFLEILGYAAAWITILVFAFLILGPFGIFVVLFGVISMLMASKFVITAHVDKLSDKIWDKVSTGSYAKRGGWGILFAIAGLIGAGMGYNILGKFLILAGMSLTGPLALLAIPIIITAIILYSGAPKWVKIAACILCAFIIGAALVALGWQALAFVGMVIVAILVAIVVFKLVSNAFIKLSKTLSDFFNLMYTMYADKGIATLIAVCMLVIIPAVILILFNALASAVLSINGVEPALFLTDKLNGALLLFLLWAASFILGSNSVIGLVNRFLKPVVDFFDTYLVSPIMTYVLKPFVGFPFMLFIGMPAALAWTYFIKPCIVEPIIQATASLVTKIATAAITTAIVGRVASVITYMQTAISNFITSIKNWWRPKGTAEVFTAGATLMSKPTWTKPAPPQPVVAVELNAVVPSDAAAAAAVVNPLQKSVDFAAGVGLVADPTAASQTELLTSAPASVPAPVPVPVPVPVPAPQQEKSKDMAWRLLRSCFPSAPQSAPAVVVQ
ncbi:MAG: hypothetical protein ACHP9Y_02715, partial [Gammaproteobacteria bacterium]